MNDNLTEIACVIDRSGSMQAIRDDAIGGFNAFLESQKQDPVPCRMTVVLFNTEYQVVHAGVAARAVPPLDARSYVPQGGTALLDAVGRTIDELGARLAATPEPERPGHVIVAILTDGEENSSRTFGYDRVASMIVHQRDVYRWEFVFLAANQDAIAAAARIAISAGDAYAWSPTPSGTREAYACLDADILARKMKRRGQPKPPPTP